MSQASLPGKLPGPTRSRSGRARTGSVDEILLRHRDTGPITAGALVDELLASHADYVDSGVIPEPTAGRGPNRTVADHVEEADRRWDDQRNTPLSGRHVVLALAIDGDVGWPLLRSGVIDSIVTRWRSGPTKRRNPERLVWDLLSPEGRKLAEDWPLLAAAFGAPAEWSLELPAPVTALAWAPGGRRVAALAGGAVYEGGPDGALRRINEVDGTVVSLGWGSDGVIALQIDDGTAEMVLVATRTVLGTVTGVTEGCLGSDGTPAWLRQSHGVVRWWTPDRPPEDGIVTPPGMVLAVDGTGRRGLVEVDGHAVLVSTLPEDEPLAEPSATSSSSWPADPARVIGRPVRPGNPCALVMLGKRAAIAGAAPDGGVVIAAPSSTPVAHVATGPGQIAAIATDSAGHCLAVAIGHRVDAWSVRKVRQTVRAVPEYQSDSVCHVDLLDADRDAQALASLIASRELRPPLAIGLFGDWGSGKSFVLDRITTMLYDLTGDDAPEGYVDSLTVVRFNAWHYAETNLWASLVDQVLQKVGPAQPAPVVPEVAAAQQRAKAADDDLKRIDRELAGADAALAAARTRLVRKRRVAWTLGAFVLLLAAAVVVVAALGAQQVVTAVGVTTALLASAVAAFAQVRNAGTQAAEIIEAGRAGTVTVGRLFGRTAELAARTAVAKQDTLADARKAAAENAERLRAEAAAIQAHATADVIGTVLGHLSTVTEYREQLSLVTRTRDRFDEINKAFGQGKSPMRRRVVIAIDDLDRCAPENVVKVLEAVHLLFNFEMFVVVLAVDTRWLDQSLRIRYRELLGQVHTAGPSDYLEKIIQIPVHLMPLDDALVRTMIAGLTGRLAAAATPAVAPAADASQPDPSSKDSPTPSPSAGRGTLTAEYGRRPTHPLPAQVLEITQQEATAMSALAPLVGTTPRTVKRFVNTYRLLKARVKDPAGFDHPLGSIGDHEIVAFLLAVTTGRPHATRLLLPALACASQTATLRSVTDSLTPPDPALADILDWVARNPRYAQAPAHRFAKWAPEVARFSFTPATTDARRGTPAVLS